MIAIDETNEGVLLLSGDHDSLSPEELERRLEYSARLASVGKLASSAAHEMNQPLNVIRMAAFNLRRAIEKGTLDPESALGKLERIDTQIARAARLVGGMKSFSPTSSDSSASLDPSPCIETVLELMAKRFTAIDVVPEYTPSPHQTEVNASASALQEVVIHLIDNALEAYGEPPQRDPFAEDDDAPPRWIRVSEGLEAQQFVLHIEDAAGGLPAEMAAHAFDAFVTSAEDGSHAGLGLTICDQFATSHGGKVTLTKTELGTRATLTLPACESPL